MTLEAIAYSVGFVLWTVVVMSVARRSAKDQSRDKTYAPHKRLNPSQITLLKEPDETRGLGLRDMDFGVEFLRIAEYDGDYYRSNRLALYDDEGMDKVADYLSQRVCEQQLETND